MPHRTSNTLCVTQIIPLYHLTEQQRAVCERVRREGGRCWTAMVAMHQEGRERGEWVSERDIEIAFANGFALHSQTIQALAQKLDANLHTAKDLRAKGKNSIQYPYKPKEYQTVPWKDMAITIVDGRIRLSNGRGREPVLLPLPDVYHTADIRKAELTWRADHYELCITIDTHVAAPPTQETGEIAGVDLGEVHIAAIVTTRQHALVISGRRLRSVKRLRNKRHAAYQERMARCTPGSRRWKRLALRKAQASAQLVRQQREILHQASRKLIDFCVTEGVARIAVGDVRDVQDSVALGKNNQKISQWTHGQFFEYVSRKAHQCGMVAEYIGEENSTRTCSVCGYQHAQAPRGRIFHCAACKHKIHRDVNGAANICMRARFGSYGNMMVLQQRHCLPL